MAWNIVGWVFFFLVACRYSPRSFCSLRCCSLRSLVAWTLGCAYWLRCSLEYFCSNTFACLSHQFCQCSLRSLLASILTHFDHWMLGHLAARSDSFTCFAADACSSYARWLRSILARMLAILACFDTCSLAGQLDGPSLRCLLGSFCSLVS
jgi:hypothetical protein